MNDVVVLKMKVYHRVILNMNTRKNFHESIQRSTKSMTTSEAE